MAVIHVLSNETINRIAAGEVVERPVNVVKELVENAIDAGSTAITVEIRNGGIDLIRVTDNGCGIEESQVRNAFRRHATSKIQDERDLSRLSTLGFRGEALSSIAAVSQVEMLTRTHNSMIGVRASNLFTQSGHPARPAASYGSAGTAPRNSQTPGDALVDAAGAAAASLQTTDLIPLDITEVGAPEGTTVIVRNLFYNVPVRRKFLKTAQTEAGYITDLMQQLALSHPDISFRYRLNSADKLQTSGNRNEKELIYRIYGREMADSVIPINITQEQYSLRGYLGRPEFSRASRNSEIFFVNDRILHSDVLSRGLEEGYRTDLMQHRFPFAILHLTIPPEETDVNVHPSKMEVRFTNPKEVFDFINEGVHQTLHRIELIPRSTFGIQQEEDEERKQEAAAREAVLREKPHTEQFETRELEAQGEPVPAPHYLNAAEGLPGDNTAADRVMDSGDEALARYGQEKSELPNNEDCSNSCKEVTRNADSIKASGEVPEEEQNREQQAPADLEGERNNTEEPGQEDFFFDDRLPAAEDRERSEGNPEKEDKSESEGTPGQEERPVTEEEPETEDKPDRKGQPRGRYEQAELFAGDTAEDAGMTEHVLSKEHIREWHIVGQVFKTYWIIEYRDKMLLIDQHAAHEKVNFERLMARLSKEQNSPAASQLLAPPVVVQLTGKEEAALQQYMDVFRKMGYEIEPFGENAYALRAVPLELYANEPDALLREVLDEILEEKMSGTPAAILYKIASMSCKAAVKGNTQLTCNEAEALIGELLSLDNPYHCPHGRPTMIILTQKDLERKFKRIV